MWRAGTATPIVVCAGVCSMDARLTAEELRRLAFPSHP